MAMAKKKNLEKSNKTARKASFQTEMEFFLHYLWSQKGFEVEGLLRDDKEINQSSGGSSFKTILLGPMNWITSAITGNVTNKLLNDEVEKTSLTNQLAKIKKPCLFLYSKYDKEDIYQELLTMRL